MRSFQGISCTETTYIGSLLALVNVTSFLRQENMATVPVGFIVLPRALIPRHPTRTTHLPPQFNFGWLLTDFEIASIYDRVYKPTEEVMVSTKTFLDTVVEGVLAILRKHNVDSKWDQVYKFKAC